MQRTASGWQPGGAPTHKRESPTPSTNTPRTPIEETLEKRGKAQERSKVQKLSGGPSRKEASAGAFMRNWRLDGFHPEVTLGQGRGEILTHGAEFTPGVAEPLGIIRPHMMADGLLGVFQ